MSPLSKAILPEFSVFGSAYRVLLSLENDSMRIFGVRHRSEAYRE